MCDVGTAISSIGLGLQGAGAIGGFIADRRTASAYKEYQTLQTQAALTNYIQQTQAINTRYSQEQEASGLKAQQIYLENLKAQATAETSAASSGVEGSSIESLFRGYDRATAISNYVSARNLQWQGIQYNEELESLRTQALSTINMEQKYASAGASTLLSGIGGIMTNYSNLDLRRQQYNYYKGIK